MFRERERGLTYSAVLHLLLLLLMVFGLPDFLSPRPPEEPAAITVELLPITGVTNVKPQEKPPSPEEKKEPEKAQAKPSPPVKTAQETPPPPPEKPAEKAKEKIKEKKPEDKPKEKKKPAPDDLDAVLKAVKETAKQQEKKSDKEGKAANDKTAFSTKYDPSLPMSLSEKDAIMSQIAKCWNVPAGARNAHELVILVNAEFNRDGSYIKVELARESMNRYRRDTFFRAAADAAIRAVKQCSPLKNLPPEKYGTWRSLELRFDPKAMLQ